MPIVLLPAWGYAASRGDWRRGVRAELGDEAPPYLWADDLLDAWLAEALGALSLRLPCEATLVVASVAGQAEYPLPLGVLAVTAVEHPPGQARVRGTSLDTARAGGAATFLVWDGRLVLRPAPAADGEAIGVRYLARRAVPAADSDPLPVEAGDEELLSLYVCARALAWVGTQEGKRQAVEHQRGAAALMLAEYYERQYQARLAARTRLGHMAVGSGAARLLAT